MENAGYATMQVIPSLRGIDALISRELAKTMPGIGQNAGRQLGGDLTTGMNTAVGGASSTTTKMVKGLVAGGLVGAGALVAGFVGSSIGAASKFEERLSAVGSVSGATGAQLDSLREKALQLGADTSFSASESATAMEELVKAGIPVAGVLDGAADATVALAAAGGVELPEAATIAANAMNQFGLAASDLPGIADQIAGAANASAIDVSDFGMSMSQAGAVANLVGLSFDDTALAITAMGNAGIKGSDAGTSLKTFMMNLEPTTEKATTLMRELGIITDEAGNRFFDAQGNVKSMAEISDVLSGALKGQSKEQQLATLSTLFGSDAIRAASVIADGGSEKFDALAESIGKVGAEEVAAARLDNLKGDLEALGGSVETLQIKTGSLATKGLRLLVQGTTDFVNLLADPPPMDFLEPLIDGADRLRPAWGDLVDAGGHIVTILGDVWDAASPVVGVLLGLGGGAVIGAITVTADVLERVLGLVAENEGAVKLFVAALAGVAAVKAWSVVSSGAAAAIGPVLELRAAVASVAATQGVSNMSAWGGVIKSSVPNVALLGEGIKGMATNLFTVPDATARMSTGFTTGAAQAKSALSSMTGGISGLTLGIGAVAAAAVVMFQGVSKAHDIAKAQISDLKPAEFDERSIDSVVRYQQALGDAYTKANEAKDGTNDFLAVVKGSAQLLTPMENSIIDNAVASGDLGKAFDVASDAADRLLKSYNTAGAELGLTGAQVEAWVMKLDLPADVVNKPAALAEAISAAKVAAEQGTPVTDALTNSYIVLADETTNSTEKLKAWQDVVDGILGTGLNVFDANTQMATALAALTTTIGESWDRTLDLNTEAGRKNREALSGAARQAIDTAAAYGETYGIEAANMVLEANREKLVESGVAAGLSREEMEDYVAQIGLTPEQVQTIIKMTGVDGARSGLQGIAEDAGKVPRNIEIAVKLQTGELQIGTDISLASALNALGKSAPIKKQNLGAPGEAAAMVAGQSVDAGDMAPMVDLTQAVVRLDASVEAATDALKGLGGPVTLSQGKSTGAGPGAKDEALRRTLVEAAFSLNGGAGLSAYEKAQGSVYAADAAHKAMGAKDYAKWTEALSRFFAGEKALAAVHQVGQVGQGKLTGAVTKLESAVVTATGVQLEALRRMQVEAAFSLNGGAGLSAYEKAQGSVYAADAAHKAMGAKDYAKWTAALSDFFAGDKAMAPVQQVGTVGQAKGASLEKMAPAADLLEFVPVAPVGEDEGASPVCDCGTKVEFSGPVTLANEVDVEMLSRELEFLTR